MEQDQNVLLKLSLISARVSFNSDQLISNIYSKLKVSLSLNSFILLAMKNIHFVSRKTKIEVMNMISSPNYQFSLKS